MNSEDNQSYPYWKKGLRNGLLFAVVFDLLFLFACVCAYWFHKREDINCPATIGGFLNLGGVAFFAGEIFVISFVVVFIIESLRPDTRNWRKGLMYEKHAGIRFLLAAIVIILVLSIIAVPFPLKARRQAQTNACVNCLHAIEAAKDQYGLEFGIPLDRVFTPDMITLYLKDTTYLRCPLAPIFATNWTDSYSIGSLTNMATCRIAPQKHRLECDWPQCPEVATILKPSSSYCYILLPLCLVGTVVIFILGRRSRTKAGETKSVVRETVSLLVRLLCGVVLFLLLPIAYASFHSMYESLSAPSSDFPLWVWPPLIATGKISSGLVLLAAWLFLQPETLRATFSKKGQGRRSLVWPMFLFLAVFVLWFIVAAYQPISYLPGGLR